MGHYGGYILLAIAACCRDLTTKCDSWSLFYITLVPRPHHSEECPGIRCLHMRLISQNSGNSDITISCLWYDYIMFAYKFVNASVSRSCK